MNFVGFKGIMNLRNNLICNNTGNKGSTNKKKEKIAISGNVGNNSNNFWNFINEGNRLGISQIIFGNNNNNKMNFLLGINKNQKITIKKMKNIDYLHPVVTMN